MKKKLLPWIIALSALLVSVSAAFYSISGLGKMFAGASTQVMILAGSLEFAKLVTASLLYQYWKKLNGFLKTYLSIATLILILITSAGIYGFLSSAYQETAFKVQNQDKNIEILNKDINSIETEIKNYETQIKQKSNRLLSLTTIRANLQSTQDILIEKSKSTTSVRKQISDIDSEIKRMDSEISAMNDSISVKNNKIREIERNKLGVSSDSDLAKEIGPLKYIADLTGKSLDQVVNWYIIVLMLVFDPLAIALVIAANFAFEMNSREENINVHNEIIEEDLNKDKEFHIINEEAEISHEKESISEISNTHINIGDQENIKEEEIFNKKEVIEEASDKYKESDPIERISLKEARERFRENPDLKGARDSIRNNTEDINPLNLR